MTKKQMPKLMEAERIILENLPKEWKWIARDECKTIFVYKDKPSKSIACWRAFFTPIPFSHLFQFIKWEDDEPYEISKLLEGNKDENNKFIIINKLSETLKLKDKNGKCYTITFKVFYSLIKDALGMDLELFF